MPGSERCQGCIRHNAPELGRRAFAQAKRSQVALNSESYFRIIKLNACAGQHDEALRSVREVCPSPSSVHCSSSAAGAGGQCRVHTRGGRQGAGLCVLQDQRQCEAVRGTIRLRSADVRVKALQALQRPELFTLTSLRSAAHALASLGNYEAFATVMLLADKVRVEMPRAVLVRRSCS